MVEYFSFIRDYNQVWKIVISQLKFAHIKSISFDSLLLLGQIKIVSVDESSITDFN